MTPKVVPGKDSNFAAKYLILRQFLVGKNIYTKYYTNTSIRLARARFGRLALLDEVCRERHND